MDLLKVFSSSVCVIGAAVEGKLNAMTASFVIPAAMNPPYITVSFDETRLTKNMIDADGKFSISVLHEDQISLARRFGFKSGKRINKFRNFDDYTLIDGLPVMNDCSAWMICRVASEMQLGDHLVVGAEVLKSEFNNLDPLVFRYEDYF